tara:strand:+ start:678 stop:785 length:108 start_codon:yes stop_codon:yes gene_type:complete
MKEEKSKKESEYYIGVGLRLGVAFVLARQKKHTNN